MEDLKKEFILPEKKVVVKYIRRKKGMAVGVSDDHVIAGGMLEGAKKGFLAPLLRNGTIANVLKSEEKETLQKITGLNLSVYGDFWKNHVVYLFKEDNILDLQSPTDYISYKILLSLKEDIAPSWNERNDKLTYQFVITSEDDELQEKRQSFDTKLEAFKIYGKINDDKEKLIGILKLITNKSISQNSTLKWIRSQVEDYLEKKPSAFLDIIKDSSLETKLLINDGVESKVIVKSGNKYSTIDGLDLCEDGSSPSFGNAVKYLDDPRHQEIRSLIEAKINNTK